MQMAADIDKAISDMVTTAMGVRNTDTTVVSLRVANLGFGLSSIFDINGEVAVTMMLRSLNHQAPQFKRMAAITMANWSSRTASCLNPLDYLQCEVTRSPRPRPKKRRRGRQVKPVLGVPQSWESARQYLHRTSLRGVATDQFDAPQCTLPHVVTAAGQIPTVAHPPSDTVKAALLRFNGPDFNDLTSPSRSLRP